jgi:UDP-3-O-[3-hydroxymyristoyl] glucosamine N-acyltransferase
VPDPRFFAVAGPFTVGALAERTGATVGAGDPARLLHDVAPLETAGPDDLSFLDNRKYVETFAASRAGAAFVQPEQAARAPAGMALLLTTQPYKAYAVAAAAFYPERPAASGVAATAVIDPSARLGPGCSIGHHVVIEERAEIGARCRIGANSVIGPGVVVGDDTRIGANVTVSHCLIGARCTLYPGVRIGQDGFGFAPDPAGHVKVPQLGRAIIEDDVEIGANATIDRGAGPDTVIGAGSMIDNLVQIGHNVVLGRGCVLVAQVGISGSTKLGDYVMAGGQAGLAGHLTIGTGARLAAKSGIMRDVAPGQSVCGFPAVPTKEFFRQVAALQRLVRNKVE